MSDATEAPSTESGSPRRQELLAASIAYAADHGLSDLALRPLAAAIGSSPRVLLYLFGSKDGLVRAVLDAAREEQLDLLARVTARTDDPWEVLAALWSWLTDPVRRGVIRLFFEAYTRSLEGATPWADFAARSLDEWLAPLAALASGAADGTGGGGDQSPGTRATLALAVMRGLLLDLLASGDDERVNRAWEAFLAAAR